MAPRYWDCSRKRIEEQTPNHPNKQVSRMREAEIRIDRADYESLGIAELVSLSREAEVQAFEELACHGDGAIIQVEVEEQLDEAALDDLEYVDQYEHVTTPGDGHLYVIGFEAPALAEEMTEQAAELVGTCDPVIDENGATMSLVGSQDAIRGVIREYVAAGLTPDLQKLGEYEGSTTPIAQLTDRQREVIEIAYQEGYYEVPRQASAEDIASELQVDASTVSEHLQRAERNLLTQHLTATA